MPISSASRHTEHVSARHSCPTPAAPARASPSPDLSLRSFPGRSDCFPNYLNNSSPFSLTTSHFSSEPLARPLLYPPGVVIFVATKRCMLDGAELSPGFAG